MELPEKFSAQISTLIGDDFDKFKSAMMDSPAVSIKLNKRKDCGIDKIRNGFDSSMKQGEWDNVAWCDSGFYLPNRPSFTLNPLLHAGTFYVQEASSMVYATIAREIIKLVTIPDGYHINLLDLCAAPGGKTTSLIDALPDSSLVVANEFIGNRAAILKENIAKWGFHNVIVTNDSSDSFASFPETFDIVAVDAPCSGEGMMRKEPAAIAQWSEGLQRQCAALQRDILKNAVSALKPGGFLIYSTCTYNTLENEDNVKWLINNFNLSPIKISSLEDYGILPGFNVDFPVYRFMPHATRGEGLFVAVLQKNGNLLLSPDNNVETKQKGKKGKNVKDRTSVPEYTHLTTLGPAMIPLVDNDILFLLTPSLTNLYNKLKAKIRIIYKGIAAETLKGNKWIPRTELALCSVYNRDAYPRHTADRDTALSYLRHEALPGLTEMPNDFVAMEFEGYPLGFVRNLGNRANNLYNKEWKIKFL